MLFYHPDKLTQSLVLSPEESFHGIKVLRYKEGDTVQITDGKGKLATATIRKPDPRKCVVEITESTFIQPDPFYLHIGISPPKNIERISWFVEKAVELGIHEISFPICRNSIRKELKIEKIRAKAISAMKQSLSAYLPKINPATDLKEFLHYTKKGTEKYICHLIDEFTPDLIEQVTIKNHYTFLIGPEGDFTEEEIQLSIDDGFQLVKMGVKRLRTETAALHACSIVNAINS